MAEQSKVVKTAAETLFDLLVGSKKKKFISATVLLIIAFLLQIRGKRSETETIKIKPEKKKVFNVFNSRLVKETSMKFL